MERLIGKTILIGKEPSQGRLLVAIQGNVKSSAIGQAGCVPACVSRCKPAEGIAHAKITVETDGKMILTNMKSQNVTYVNGAEIASKRVSVENTIELGKDRFSVNLPMVIEAAKKIAVSPSSHSSKSDITAATTGVKKYNISHLEHVWSDINDRRKEILSKQKKINLVRSGCGVFTMCAMPCISIFGYVGYILTGIGIVGNIYSFVGLKYDDTKEVIEQLNEDFQDRYVCPNPDCNKFLGNISYKLLKKQYSLHLYLKHI